MVHILMIHIPVEQILLTLVVFQELTLKWETATQTETERTVPLELQNPSIQDVPGEAGNGICNYIYCSETTSTAIGAIEILLVI